MGLTEDALVVRVAQIMERESQDWHSEKSGATLHKINTETATRVARLVIVAAKEARSSSGGVTVPLAYAMGAIRQESAFDPEATNPNGFPGVVEKTDWGLGQISGRNLIAMGVVPEVALTPEWAAPATCRRLRDLLDWAKINFPKSDPFYCAALAYNRGRTGATLILTRKTKPGLKGYETLLQLLQQIATGRLHANRVMGHTRRFRDELGLQAP